MVPVEEALANKFLPKIIGLESISGRLSNLPSLWAKREGLRIPNLKEAADKSNQNSLAFTERLVEFLLTGEAFSTINHRACISRRSRGQREIKVDREEAQLGRVSGMRITRGACGLIGMSWRAHISRWYHTYLMGPLCQRGSSGISSESNSDYSCKGWDKPSTDAVRGWQWPTPFSGKGWPRHHPP